MQYLRFKTELKGRCLKALESLKHNPDFQFVMENMIDETQRHHMKSCTDIEVGNPALAVSQGICRFISEFKEISINAREILEQNLNAQSRPNRPTGRIK